MALFEEEDGAGCSLSARCFPLPTLPMRALESIIWPMLFFFLTIAGRCWLVVAPRTAGLSGLGGKMLEKPLPFAGDEPMRAGLAKQFPASSIMSCSACRAFCR